MFRIVVVPFVFVSATKVHVNEISSKSTAVTQRKYEQVVCTPQTELKTDICLTYRCDQLQN